MKKIILFVLFMVLSSSVAVLDSSVAYAKKDSIDMQLLKAVVGKDFAKVKKLLKKGGDPNVYIRGVTPLMLAAQLGSKNIVQELIKSGADTNLRAESAEDKSIAGATALFVATNALKNDGQDQIRNDIIVILLKEGANPDAHLNGVTPLIVAASKGEKEAIQSLIKYGANVNMQVRDQDTSKKETIGMTALFMAVGTKKSDADTASGDIIMMLLKAGAHPDARLKGITPLMAAAKKGDKRTVQELLRYKADINARDAGGNSVMDYAKDGGNTSVINLLK